MALLGYRVVGDIAELVIADRSYRTRCWVDAEDLPIIKHYSWTLLFTRRESANRSKQAFIVAAVPDGCYGQKTIYLHRLVMNAGPGEEVDHKNGNRLNCRKSNLRKVPHAVNMLNRHGAAKGSAVSIRGIQEAASGGWIATASSRYLGTFSEIGDAVHAVWIRLLEIDPVSATSFLRSLPLPISPDAHIHAHEANPNA